jgi:hypothetical protein
MLEAPDFPESLDYLLGYYDELAISRSAGMSGLDPIRYADIEAWQRLMDISLEPHEVVGLLQIDMATRFPGDAEEEAKDMDEPRIDPPWPGKK